MQKKSQTLAPEPLEVELKREKQTLIVRWSDRHESFYHLRYLRGFCPCAECQGHEIGDWKFIESPADIAITSIEPMGNYALSICFSDSHNTGIYSWEILRELCPCNSCRELYGDKHPMVQYPSSPSE